MKPRNIFITVIGVTLIFLFSAQLARRSALAAATASKTVEVTHNRPNDHNVDWKMKDEGQKGAFLLPTKKGNVVQWQNKDAKEAMSIIVNDSNKWQIVQGAAAFKPATYGPGCATCGQVDIAPGTNIQLTSSNININTLTNHYQIVVADPDKVLGKPGTLATTYDYDMVDAPIVWS